MRRNITLLSICALLVTGALLTACGGGGGGSSIPSSPSQTGSGMGSMALTLKIPALSSQARAHMARSVTPMYASPAVKGVGMSIVANGGTPPAVASPQLAFDLSTCSATGTVTCVANGDGSRSYSVSSPLVPFGTYTVVISTWDVAPSGNSFSGNELSEGTAPVTVSGTSVNVNVTLNGIPKSVVMTSIGGQTHIMANRRSPKGALPIPTPFMPVGNTPTQWAITALDADGYIIAGSAAPIMSFSDPTNTVSLTQTSPQSNIYTMKVLQAQPSLIALGITATYAAQAGPATATTTVRVQPVQELWTTITGVGIAGYPLDPNNPINLYMPDAEGCCATSYEQTDGVATTDALGAIAQDANGNIWVVDTTSGTINQYSVGTGSTGMAPTGAAIPIKGLSIAGLAGDANGFLYGADTASNSLKVWNASTQALAFSVPIASAPSPGPGNPLGVSVIPSGSGVAAGIAGTIMVADVNGVDFYSNAKNGQPGKIGNAPNTYVSTGAYSMSVATDTGTLWMLEGSGGGSTIGVYSLNSSLGSSQLGASTSSSDDEIGYISAAVGNYGYTSNGSNGWQFYQYQYTPSGPSMGQPASFPTSGGSYTWGVLVVP